MFNDIVSIEKQHKNYKLVRDTIGHSAARTLLNEVYNSVKPIDKDFVVQFQSNGFDSRIWELSLLAAFQEQKFSIARAHERPDFELSKNDKKIFVEAVISNPAFNEQIEDKMDVIKNIPKDGFEKFIYELRNESTIRIAGALFNKLKKEYWKLDWVAGNPIILAVEPFHHSLSHWLSDSNLTGYLYGIENNWHYDDNQNLNIETFEITEHKSTDKSIPSNFFNLKNSEYISAVIFSNSGTISKFNRMGKLKNYGNSDIEMIRIGNMYDHNPNASTPIPFQYMVGKDGPIENWAQGISMYHNPKAKYPIDRKMFPDFLHGYNDNGFYAYVPRFYPYQSETHIMIPEKYRNKDSR
ncbi:glycosaminoglycan attachment protein [Flavobacterium noncentrifugens]|uniref:glycosaminoglycan attachment protein n=1 Tax=Flavobacterium noncentrifugens TaxID=1128970 RepID=UPI001113B89F|nr:glycosaminoglycan attachment protein [Flavobacterium noncentrifugens]